MAIITNNISGSSSGASRLGITGSVIVANRQQGQFPSMPGSDAVFFVSGSRGSDVSVFGGDLIVSGGLSAQGDIVEITGSLIVTSGITGSLTKLSNGTSYLVAGANVTISSASNGSITISSTGGGGSSFFNSTTSNAIFTTGSTAFVGGELGIDSPVDKGADVWFYVSGSISGSGSENRKALFGGDVVLSGALSQGRESTAVGTYSLASGLETIASGSAQAVVGKYNTRGNNFSLFVVGNGTGDSNSNRSDVFRVNASNVEVTGSLIVTGSLQVTGSFLAQGDLLEMTGTLSVTNGISGSLTKLADGTSYLVAGTNISITSQSNGSVLVTSTFSQASDYFDSTTADSIFTTGSVAFKGNESAIDAPVDKGADVFFYVSGSSGSLGGAVPGVALFGGDVRISGSLLIGTGSVKVTSNDIQFGGPGLRIEKRGSDLSLSGNAQLTGSLYSSGNVTVTGFFAGTAQTFTTSPVSDGDSQHLSIFTPSTDPQLVTLEDGRSVGQLKYCVATSVSGEVRITPTSKIGSWSYVRLPKATLGSTAVFLWTGTAWAYFGGYGSSVV